ncbi:MAG: hypothetical protein ACAH59_04880 [Pseudobdellovibrionaceae bacterium]
MHLHGKGISLFILFGILTACSVYESTGRKSFESNAPGQLENASTGVQTKSAPTSETCWNQPANEALWYIDQVSPLTIDKINEEEIQVCFQEVP